MKSAKCQRRKRRHSHSDSVSDSHRQCPHTVLSVSISIMDVKRVELEAKAILLVDAAENKISSADTNPSCFGLTRYSILV